MRKGRGERETEENGAGERFDGRYDAGLRPGIEIAVPTVVLVSLALGWWVNPLWFLFTTFVGLNLVQSSFTLFCPLERVLRRFRLFGCVPAATS